MKIWDELCLFPCLIIVCTYIFMLVFTGPFQTRGGSDTMQLRIPKQFLGSMRHALLEFEIGERKFAKVFCEKPLSPYKLFCKCQGYQIAEFLVPLKLLRPYSCIPILIVIGLANMEFQLFQSINWSVKNLVDV